MVKLLFHAELQVRIVRLKAVHERFEGRCFILMCFQIFVRDLKVAGVIARWEIMCLEAFIKCFRFGEVFVSLCRDQR